MTSNMVEFFALLLAIYTFVLATTLLVRYIMQIKVNIEIPALDKIAEALGGINNELAQLNSTAIEIIKALNPPEAARIRFFVVDGDKLQPIGGSMFQKVTEPKKFAIKVTDRFGNDAKVDGAPAWAATDESLADIAVSEDGLSAVVTPKGPLGAFKLQVKADADLGEGVKELLGEVEIELAAGDAEVLTIAEVPVEEPAPEEPAPEA